MMVGTGWDPERAAKATEELILSGRYMTVAGGAGPRRKAYSLSKNRLRDLFQGGAGTCWVHAAVALAEYVGRGQGYDVFPICRRLAGWVAKQNFEGGGNPSDGGSITDAVRAMTDGIAGIAHEALFPYTDNVSELGLRPPQSVFEDATTSHMTVPIRVQDRDGLMAIIDNDHPAGLGIWWTRAWDQSKTFMDEGGPADGGHALLVTGYATPGVFSNDQWWQLTNWHGLIYPPLSPTLSAKVEGYVPSRPDRTTDFWLSDSLLSWVVRQGPCELVSATNLTGRIADVLVPSAHGTFPV